MVSFQSLVPPKSWLTNFQNTSDMAPLLHPRYQASSLIRAIPPLCLASVLRSLWVLHLDCSLNIEATGSRVPCTCLNRTHATFMPDAALAVSRFSPELIPG